MTDINNYSEAYKNILLSKVDRKCKLTGERSQMGLNVSIPLRKLLFPVSGLDFLFVEFSII